jgi:uncharacterized protein
VNSLLRILLDVTDLLKERGLEKELRIEQELEPIETETQSVKPTKPFKIELKISNIDGMLRVEGKMRGTVKLACSRCLEEYKLPIFQPIDAVFSPKPFDQETYPVTEGKIDIGQVIEEVLLLAIPMKPLCREDCKGLCPKCGQNLNFKDCGHKIEPIDIRLGRLKEWFNK